MRRSFGSVVAIVLIFAFSVSSLADEESQHKIKNTKIVSNNPDQNVQEVKEEPPEEIKEESGENLEEVIEEHGKLYSSQETEALINSEESQTSSQNEASQDNQSSGDKNNTEETEEVKEMEENDDDFDEFEITEPLVVPPTDDVPTDAQEMLDDPEPQQMDPATCVRTYHGYKLIRTMPKSQEHLDVLKFISKGNLVQLFNQQKSTF